MNEPLLDMGEIVEMYRTDARHTIQQMREAINHWEEVAGGGSSRKELRRCSHQLRGSGRTYGFFSVSRIAKAMERIVEKVEARILMPDERVRRSLAAKIEKLSGIFQG